MRRRRGRSGAFRQAAERIRLCRGSTAIDVTGGELELPGFRFDRVSGYYGLVHVRYFAVRDEQKRYKGTLEVTQDMARYGRCPP